MIDWPSGHPPVDALVDIDTHRRVLLSALRTELATDQDLSTVEENDEEIRETAARAVLVVESFLARLPGLEIEAAAGRLTVLSDQEVGERAIVLQLLRHDRPGRWSRAELESEIYDIDPLTVNDALQALRGEGVLHTAGEEVWASRCARRLDLLGMVSI